jgi:hypothetical protein
VIPAATREGDWGPRMNVEIVRSDGVQNLFFEVDLAYGAFKDIWAGKTVDKMLIDPGFAISQATLDSKREDMWGYHVWKEKNK